MFNIEYNLASGSDGSSSRDYSVDTNELKNLAAELQKIDVHPKQIYGTLIHWRTLCRRRGGAASYNK
jgi:hypothetical protein